MGLSFAPANHSPCPRAMPICPGEGRARCSHSPARKSRESVRMSRNCHSRKKVPRSKLKFTLLHPETPHSTWVSRSAPCTKAKTFSPKHKTGRGSGRGAAPWGPLGRGSGLEALPADPRPSLPAAGGAALTGAVLTGAAGPLRHGAGP